MRLTIEQVEARLTARRVLIGKLRVRAVLTKEADGRKVVD